MSKQKIKPRIIKYIIGSYCQTDFMEGVIERYLVSLIRSAGSYLSLKSSESWLTITREDMKKLKTK